MNIRSHYRNILNSFHEKTGESARSPEKEGNTRICHSPKVTVPQRLGLVLIFRLPLQAICGMYSVPGQG